VDAHLYMSSSSGVGFGLLSIKAEVKDGTATPCAYTEIEGMLGIGRWSTYELFFDQLVRFVPESHCSLTPQFCRGLESSTGEPIRDMSYYYFI